MLFESSNRCCRKEFVEGRRGPICYRMFELSVNTVLQEVTKLYSEQLTLKIKTEKERIAEFLDSASKEFLGVTNICVFRVVKVSFIHLLKSDRP